MDPREKRTTIQEMSVSTQVDANGLLAKAAEHKGQEMRPSVNGEIQAKRDYDWTSNPDMGHRPGQTLAAQERQLGEEKEMEEYREKALTRHKEGRNPEVESREAVEYQARCEHDEFEAHAASAGNGADPEQPDIRERLDAEDLADVNKFARKLHREVSNAPEPSAIGRMLAEKIDKGKSMMAAVIETKEGLYEESGCPQPIEMLESWMARYDMGVAIEGTVKTLWEPKSVNQQQVGLIEDESGTVKFTVWENSMQTTVLQEGDQVRVTGAKVGWYGGQATLAADSETDIQILERGDGPAPLHGIQYQVEWDADTPEDPSINEEEDENVERLANKRHRRVSRDDDMGVVLEAEWWKNTEQVFPEVSWMSEAWKESERVEKAE